MPKFSSLVDFLQISSKNFVLEKGTAFPASPVVGQKFYRTDLNAEYVCTVGGGTPTWATNAGAVVNTSTQGIATANTSVSSTNAAAPNAITGCTKTITVGATTEVYEIEIDLVGLFTAVTDVVGVLWLDGAAQNGAMLFSAAAGRYQSGHRKWTYTGLSVGNHTFDARAYLIAATTVTMAQTHSVITVTRIS